MTYFPDGARYTYGLRGNPHAEEDAKAVCAGWLDGTHPFRTGDPPAGFIPRLAWLCVNDRHAQTRGVHDCELCDPDDWSAQTIWPTWGGRLGSAEIRVRTPHRLYAAPDLVLHYVVDHGYLPPDDFVEAVLALPDSQRIDDLTVFARAAR